MILNEKGFGFKGFKKFKTRKMDKGHLAQFKAFVDLVGNGGESLIGFDEIVNVTLASFAAMTSAAEGRMIHFRIYKFRTMFDKRDANGNLLPDSQRLSKWGRFLRATSLDELPELFNVFKGDMSFVGPRPLLMQYLNRYTPEQARRHEVKPGITGWAQVNGRNAILWEEKFKLDVWYVDNQSLALDLRILLMTMKNVLMREGISAEGEATATEFNPQITQIDADREGGEHTNG